MGFLKGNTEKSKRGLNMELAKSNIHFLILFPYLLIFNPFFLVYTPKKIGRESVVLFSFLDYQVANYAYNSNNGYSCDD